MLSFLGLIFLSFFEELIVLANHLDPAEMSHYAAFHVGLHCLPNRLRAKKGPAPPPLGNFADISYLEGNFKPHLLRDVCTLCSGALVSYSLLHMLLYQTKEKIKMKV